MIKYCLAYTDHRSRDLSCKSCHWRGSFSQLQPLIKMTLISMFPLSKSNHLKEFPQLQLHRQKTMHNWYAEDYKAAILRVLYLHFEITCLSLKHVSNAFPSSIRYLSSIQRCFGVPRWASHMLRYIQLACNQHLMLSQEAVRWGKQGSCAITLCSTILQIRKLYSRSGPHMPCCPSIFWERLVRRVCVGFGHLWPLPSPHTHWPNCVCLGSSSPWLRWPKEIGSSSASHSRHWNEYTFWEFKVLFLQPDFFTPASIHQTYLQQSESYSGSFGIRQY